MQLRFKYFSWRSLVAVCLILTSIRWLLVAIFSHYFIGQLFAQCLHAFSFGLFHLIAMRLIFQNFSIGQQGRGQAFIAPCGAWSGVWEHFGWSLLENSYGRAYFYDRCFSGSIWYVLCLLVT